MLLALSLASLITFILPLIYSLIFKTSSVSKSNKLTSFECGFEPMAPPRRPFSVRFFLLVVLFLVFDVESVLLFPYLSNNILTLSFTYSLNLYIFCLILLCGLLYEWYNSMLDWC
uniref:NADH-ubiquinone oxidoreductase chain 3 n=1 Tax=Cornu aspersum TaxID=6535 RepID=S4SA18_CORAP|nr:NADH dehydrogenase subunit 3 [Cornu aspersum]